jgi:hypothetical protein
MRLDNLKTKGPRIVDTTPTSRQQTTEVDVLGVSAYGLASPENVGSLLGPNHNEKRKKAMAMFFPFDRNRI